MTERLANKRPIVRLALTKTEVALAIGVGTASVDTMVAEGALPRPRVWHSKKLWLVSEIEAALNELPVEGEMKRASSLQEWRSDNAYYEPKRGVGGYPIVDDPKDPVRKYYDDLGFDPRTMGKKEMHELTQAAAKRWRASIPGTPLNKRERNSLVQFGRLGANVKVSWDQIKGMGPDTVDRLEARGFIEVRYHNNDKTHLESFLLTDAGFAAMQEIVDE